MSVDVGVRVDKNPTRPGSVTVQSVEPTLPRVGVGVENRDCREGGSRPGDLSHSSFSSVITRHPSGSSGDPDTFRSGMYPSATKEKC